MTYNEAKKLLTVNFNNLPLEELQRYKVKLIDAMRESDAEYGFNQAVLHGFYKIIYSESANGYSPTDIYLSHNLQAIFEKVISAEKNLLGD